MPVGGGLIFAAKGVVVTQPTQGEFKAFSSVCTHQNCPVTSVDGGTINCTCHDSKFSITDGSVKTGPATRPLAAKSVKVDGENITLALTSRAGLARRVDHDRARPGSAARSIHGCG